MDFKDFKKLFYALAMSKLYKIYDPDIVKIYYEDLKEMEEIENILINARQKEYKNIMPLLTDLIKDHKEFLNKKNNKMSLDFFRNIKF